MGLMRVGGGIAGIVEYLVHGKKQGQELTRDELDERVILSGDLEVTRKIIEGMESSGQKYLHLTFSFKERDLSVEKFREINDFLKEKILAAYSDGEIDWYSELQRPKVKNVLNKATGEWHERLDHIHIVIPEINLVTGKKENPIGIYDRNVKFFDAIQELANIKFGLASPKDNARVDISHADIISRSKDTDSFKKGSFKDFKSELINDILMKDIKDYDSFREHLKGIRTVKVVNAGKDNEYLGVKEFGKDRFINLREPEFLKSFFELPDAEREQRLGAGHDEKKPSRMGPKLTQEAYEDNVQEWVDRRSKEVRYLNSGSKLYKKYFAGNQEEKAEILAYYEERAQAQRLKMEKEHDDKYRESGRPDGRRRSALAKDAERAGERIFAERAERDAFARAMGGNHQPGLAVRGLEDAPRLGDSVHGLSQGNVAGEQRSAALLVQGNAHDVLEAGRSVAAGHQLQRPPAGNAGRDGVNPATGRTSDNAAAQLLRDVREAVRQEAGEQQPTIKEIKTHLDAKRLLADLAVSHLLRPEDYVISQGSDGGARIRHVGGHHGGMQRYNVSDFLTKHLHLNWNEAQPYLVASYERQKNAEPIQKVAAKAKRDLWADFQADRAAQAIDYPEDQVQRKWERQRKSEAERRAEIQRVFVIVKTSIAQDPRLSDAQRKAQRSVAQMGKVESLRNLRLEIERERAALKQESSIREKYRRWLQSRAQNGEQDALAELRAQNTEPEKQAASDRTIAAAGNEPEIPSFMKQTASDRLQYTVSENGDVTYSRRGRDLLVDTGRKVYMIDKSDDAVERGLRLAAQKWGGKMRLSGTDEFIEQSIEIAARKKMRIEFADPEHQARLNDKLEKARKGMEYIVKQHEKALDEDAAKRKAPLNKLRENQPAQPAAPQPAQPATPQPDAAKGDSVPGRDARHDDRDDDQERDREIDAPR